MTRDSARSDWSRRLGHARGGVNPTSRARRSRHRARKFHRSPAAGADLAAFAALNAARVLDVPTGTPARPDSRSPCESDHLHALASGIGEICALVRRFVGAPAAIGALLLAGAAKAADLLVGTAPNRDGAMLEFRLQAENRRDVVGGRIYLGEFEYEISRVSRLGLIGARRFVRGDDARRGRYAEFLVVASSFSEQTAVGKPWIAARAAYGCDRPYNTYVGFYRVEGEAAVKALGPIPYPDLAEDLSRSQHSHVACFVARPPG